MITAVLVFSAIAVTVFVVQEGRSTGSGLPSNTVGLPPQGVVTGFPPASLPSTGSSTGSAPGTTTTTPAVATVAGPDEALAALRARVAADRTAVEALVGYWVPQLSSKRPGIVDKGITYGHEEIWLDFTALSTRYPGARLLWSGDFTSFKFPDFWITVMPVPYGDGDGANSWCDAQAIPVDDCYAKRLAHSGSYEGSTLHRT